MLQISAHPLVWAQSNVHRPWALFHETTVQAISTTPHYWSRYTVGCRGVHWRWLASANTFLGCLSCINVTKECYQIARFSSKFWIRKSLWMYLWNKVALRCNWLLACDSQTLGLDEYCNVFWILNLYVHSPENQITDSLLRWQFLRTLRVHACMHA